jgi:hypothetical protein
MSQYHFVKILLLHFCMSIILVCGLATLANALSVEHNLEVELLPVEHKLIGLNRMEIHTEGDESLAFRLSEKAEHISVELNDGCFFWRIYPSVCKRPYRSPVLAALFALRRSCGSQK